MSRNRQSAVLTLWQNENAFADFRRGLNEESRFIRECRRVAMPAVSVRWRHIDRDAGEIVVRFFDRRRGRAQRIAIGDRAAFWRMADLFLEDASRAFFDAPV